MRKTALFLLALTALCYGCASQDEGTIVSDAEAKQNAQSIPQQMQANSKLPPEAQQAALKGMEKGQQMGQKGLR